MSVDQVVADMEQRIAEALTIEEELLEIGERPSDDGDGDQGVDLKFVARCFRLNERGDGMLYAHLNRDRHVYVKLYDQWLVWSGHHWEIDQLDLNHNAVDQVALQYERIRGWMEEMADDWDSKSRDEKGKSDELEKEYLEKAKVFRKRSGKYQSRIDYLRSITGAKNCLQWAHKIGVESVTITGEELDQKPWLLPCKNCVVDLATGKTTTSTPGDWMLKSVAVEWKGMHSPRAVWERFFAEIHQHDAELMEFVHALLGYASTGLMTEHFIACFIGEGRNGKGTMFETLRSILGDLSWSVSPELILEQKNARSSAGPSPDLVSLQGRRMVLASETDESRRISASKIKLLTGNDTINARAPHEKKEINFRPSHKLFLYTNHLPNGLARDYALRKRLLLIDYPLKFIDDPKEPNERQRDPDLPEKLAKEAPGILAWLVEGALKWRAAGGLRPPERIKAEVNRLQLKEDAFMRFFEERLEVVEDTPQNKIRFSDLYQAFRSWYEEEVKENDRYMPSKIAVSNWLTRNKYRKDKPGGVAYFFGLQLKVLDL